MKKMISLIFVFAMLFQAAAVFSSCGIKGEPGLRGEQGIQGEKGDKGDQGEQGIQGEKGDKGDRGEQGIQGEKGDKGDQGEQGIQGEKGETGATIAHVAYDSQGRLVITLTDGTVLDPIELPEKEEHLHSFGEWITLWEVSCEKDGLQLRFCAECHDTESRSITSTGHREEILAGTAVTCTQDGMTDGSYCVTCGAVLKEQEVIRANGHVMAADPYEEKATCTRSGCVSAEKCAVCDYRPDLIQTDPLGHVLDEDGTCTLCGQGVGEYWEGLALNGGGDTGEIALMSFQECMIEGDADLIIPTALNGTPVSKNLQHQTCMEAEWLTSLTIPEYFTEIGYYFAGECVNLKYVYIPSTVVSIAWDAFYGCVNLEVIHFGGTREQWDELGFILTNEHYTVICTG